MDPNTATAFSTASHGRSYDCNFCKMGFSNAQALGGHMNIHRKHRALKPKKPAARGSQPHISTSSASSSSSSSSSYFPPSNKSLLYSWIAPAEQAGSQKPLAPLFMKMPVIAGVENDGRGRIAHDLDLELRLGLQPALKTSM